MFPIEFAEQSHVIAKNQPIYLPLPAHIGSDGCVTSCWKLSFKERLILLFTGKLWLQQLTFHSPLQPQKPQTIKPKFSRTLLNAGTGHAE